MHSTRTSPACVHTAAAGGVSGFAARYLIFRINVQSIHLPCVRCSRLKVMLQLWELAYFGRQLLCACPLVDGLLLIEHCPQNVRCSLTVVIVVSVSYTGYGAGGVVEVCQAVGCFAALPSHTSHHCFPECYSRESSITQNSNPAQVRITVSST